MKHTKGKRIINGEPIKINGHYYGVPYGYVVEVISEGYKGGAIGEIWGNSHDECLANAEQFCKAPEMYEALKEADKELTFHNWHNSKTGLLIQSLLKELE